MVGTVMPPRHSDWQLDAARGSVAYEAGRGVSTGAARDAGGAIGHLSSGE